MRLISFSVIIWVRVSNEKIEKKITPFLSKSPKYVSLHHTFQKIIEKEYCLSPHQYHSVA